MTSIKDDRGYNQGFLLAESTKVRMKRRAAMLLSEMRRGAEVRILEIGCGTGEVSYWLAEQTEAQVLGTDLCRPFIEDAKKNYRLPNLRYEMLDFNATDQCIDERFDYIVGNGILHHLYNNLDEVLENMSRLLNTNGKIIFLEPNLYNPYIFLIFSIPFLRKFAHLEPDEMAFSKRFIAKKLRDAGFSKVQIDYKDFLLPGIPSIFVMPSIICGAVLEKLPMIKMLSQSIFIRASNESHTVSVSAIQPEESFFTYKRLRFFLRYGISGIIGALAQTLFLFMWVSLLDLQSTYLVGLVLGFIIALIVTFVLQKLWAFRDRGSIHTRHQLLSYTAVALSGLVLNALLLSGSKALFEALSINFFDSWYLIVQIVSIGIVAIFTFVMNFGITFRHARKDRTWES